MMKIATLAALIGCGSSLPAARFANAPPVVVVDDRHDVPKAPAERSMLIVLHHFDNEFLRVITRPFELHRDRRALGVNALDEVPDSTWFTNRIGVRELSLDEVAHGPETAGSPEPHKPWTIKSTKVGGQSTGFVIADARGEKYLLKFEVRDHPEAETAADAITSRILWACGFNVPEDHVVYVRRDELVLAADATIKDVSGKKRPLVVAELDRRLATIDVGADKRMRGLVSRFIPGKPIGGHPSEGVRSDDPNDRIPHELRRDLRGQYPIWAWLDHVDVKEQNTLDMWTSDAGEPSRHHVEHYQVDFGKSLGTMAVGHMDRRNGHEYNADYGQMLASLASAGLHERTWEHRSVPKLRGVGLYDVKAFDPGTWKPLFQGYIPFRTADRFDKFWGAKIAIRFTREHLRVIVDAGRLTDPRAAQYLVDALVARQRATAKYWFDRVAPLDHFATRDNTLCFDDLAVTYGLAAPNTTSYTITVYDHGGRPLGKRVLVRPAGTNTCSEALPAAKGRDGYTMVRIDVARPGTRTSVIVHVATDPSTATVRVIGLWRM